jgi:hypothetical protein
LPSHYFEGDIIPRKVGNVFHVTKVQFKSYTVELRRAERAPSLELRRAFVERRLGFRERDEERERFLVGRYVRDLSHSHLTCVKQFRGKRHFTLAKIRIFWE